MRKIRRYLPNVLLTILLVFSLMGTLLCGTARLALQESTYRSLMKQYALGELSEELLEKRFAQRANTTGIPAETALTGADSEALTQWAQESVTQALSYLKGQQSQYALEPDLSASDAALTAFFSDYADENGYEKDAAYDAKVAQTISETHEEILSAADCFKFRMLYENGYLDTARRYVPLIGQAFTGLLVLTLVLAALLVLCNKGQLPLTLYWLGLAGLTAGGILLVPGIYLAATDYFAGFAVKDPQIFTAIVGLLRYLTDKLVNAAADAALLGMISIIAFAVLVHVGKTKQNA